MPYIQRKMWSNREEQIPLSCHEDERKRYALINKKNNFKKLIEEQMNILNDTDHFGKKEIFETEKKILELKILSIDNKKELELLLFPQELEEFLSFSRHNEKEMIRRHQKIMKNYDESKNQLSEELLTVLEESKHLEGIENDEQDIAPHKKLKLDYNK